jgi:glyoxylate/hydroxypyruvate reductase
MSTEHPHIFYASELDRSAAWRAALATEFDSFELSTADSLVDPQTVDVALLWRIPEEGLGRFTRLRAVLSLGAGVNQIGLERIPPHVPLAKLADVTLTAQMVEYAKATVYRYHRRLHIFERHSARAHWQFELPMSASKTRIAVLGLGSIGLAVAEALRDEGFTVGAWSRHERQLDGMRTHTHASGLETLLGESDIVINLLPLTAQTRRLFDRRLFGHFSAGSKLINMGRGAHIVEADLLEALAGGRLEAATLDVFDVEPLPPAHPFWNHPAILVTPHAAGVSSPMTAIAHVAENIRRALAGKPLLNQVDIQRGY